MANKENRERFENMDYLRGNEAFKDYTSYYDNYDLRQKDKELKSFVCKMSLDKSKRSALLKELNTPLV